jgi:formylglycine-generating enzyme
MTKLVSPFPFRTHFTFIWIALQGFAFGSPSTAAKSGEMKRIASGSFEMGCESECPMDDAKPRHKVTVSEFWIDITPVTNQEFAKFVQATNYRTVAERIPTAAELPGVAPDKRVAGSACFSPANVTLDNPYAWWQFVAGANWRHPEGPKSPDSAKKLPSHPAVHIAFEDALAFCNWAGKTLPTEAQFEYAARGGLSRKKYSWGDDLKSSGKWQANIWQGEFPKSNLSEDGFKGTSPVKAFPANGYGLYDMGGNVWQWTLDWYRPTTYADRVKPGVEIKDPKGPADSVDPSEPGVAKRVQRGGSYLCSDQYCVRYLVGSRGRGEPKSSASNLGFRCVRNESR